MKAQQAPLHPSGLTPPWAMVAQVARSVPVQAALISSHSTMGGIAQTRKMMAMMERIASLGVANMLALTH